MSSIRMVIHKIKGIENGVLEVPIENGIYAIVGNNGTGKSTIVSCLAQLLSRHNLGLLRKEDYGVDSYVEFSMDSLKDHWYCNDNFWQTDSFPKTIRFNGTYEGSLFYGMRFKDSKNVDELMEAGQINDQDVVAADDYIREHLGIILHNQSDFYLGLKRIRNKGIADKLGLKNTPYFLEVNNNLISQYRMSSGECLLISLLHFIYNSIIRRSLPTGQPILMLIDEIELALHPVAIVNLLDLLKGLIPQFKNLTVILTSHSPEVIRKINPNNIFKLERVNNSDNDLEIVNPCYPSYAIRDVYTHDGFDNLLLVEDELAKMVVKKALDILGLEKSRLINVLPVGGWRNVLKLQYELINKNVLGVGRQVFSILDGDVQGYVSDDFKNLTKLYLPINSIEKYLLNVLIDSPIPGIKKKINDRFFNIESINTVISRYLQHEKEIKAKLGKDYRPDSDGKRLYHFLVNLLSNRSIIEESFISGLYEIIITSVDFTKFYDSLIKKLA